MMELWPEDCQKCTMVRIMGQYWAEAYQLMGLSLKKVAFKKP